MTVATEDQHRDMLMQSNLVNSICEPLFKISGINSYGYFEFDEQGNYAVLESNPDFYRELMNQDVFGSAPTTIAKLFKKPGVYSSELTPSDCFAKKAYKIFDQFKLGNFLRIVDLENSNDKAVLKVYTYGTDTESKAVNHFYLNNLELLHQFNHHFKKRMRIYLNRANKIHLSREQKGKFDRQKDIFRARKDTPVSLFNTHKRPPIHYLSVEISDRERTVITQKAQGKTATEIGQDLYISKRTVERHLENLRLKFDCSSTQKLVAKLMRAGLISI